MNDKTDQRSKANKLLAGAYALKTSADNTSYYREFAPIYDEQFADALGYTYPGAVANVYKLQHDGGVDFPVLDVGCGTGLVAESLDISGDIDGVDLSAEMLAVAQDKQLYRDLYRHDLTAGSGPLPRDYGGVISAGTFTHGHLGPEVLAGLLVVGRPGALFCIGINAAHYEKEGFGAMFRQLGDAGELSDYREVSVENFNGGDGAKKDQALVAVFRRTSG